MSDPHDNVLLEDEYLDAAKELRDIAAEKKRLADREAELKAIMEKVLTVGERGVAPDGTPLVAIKAGAKRFSADLAEANLPPDVLASIQVTVADGKRAKAILAPALYDLCVDYNKSSVVAL